MRIGIVVQDHEG
jgi:hypothetical protein